METESMAGVRPDGGTRAQLLAITERLMSAAGYEGVAIKDIAAVAGLRPAAIFYHFPTKADLVAAALDASVKALAGRLAELDGQHADPMARVRAFIDYFGAVKRARNEFCFAGVLAASCKGLPENVAVGVKQFEAQIAEWAAGHFREAFPDLSGDMVRAKGEAVLALAEGALLVTRMSGDQAAYDRVVAAILPKLVER
ncbi:MAG TPA: TetR/AcrR family transcriptional regulator [Rhabdaerophilum sp.]|nr:TetR/AcrR family transcriptional regulator [Rhabdaerophilum sp.]